MSHGTASPGTSNLEAVLAATPRLWKGRQANHVQAVLSTGHTRLDRQLPGGGWPRGALSELITARPGQGEFSLLFPALAEAGAAGRWLLLVDPPWIPYPATLHGHGLCLERLLLIRTAGRDEALWACEQALRSMPEGILLSWPGEIRFAALRRLQLAAESRGATAFLFRPEAAAAAASPAALRLKLACAAHGLSIRVLKCRGQRPAQDILLPYPHCGQAEPHERTPIAQTPGTQIRTAQSTLAGATDAATGVGRMYPRPSRQARPHRHH